MGNQHRIALVFCLLAWLACVNAVIAAMFGAAVHPFVIAAVLSAVVAAVSEHDRRLQVRS